MRKQSLEVFVVIFAAVLLATYTAQERWADFAWFGGMMLVGFCFGHVKNLVCGYIFMRRLRKFQDGPTCVGDCETCESRDECTQE
jgi:uncharacterized membrane protein